MTGAPHTEKLAELNGDIEATDALLHACTDQADREKLNRRLHSLEVQRSVFTQANRAPLAFERRRAEAEQQRAAEAAERAELAQLPPILAEYRKRQAVSPVAAAIFYRAHTLEIRWAEDELRASRDSDLPPAA